MGVSTLVTGIAELVTNDPTAGPGRLGTLTDAAVVVDDGRIAARGTHDDLLETSEVYRDIYEHGLLERQFADAVEARAAVEEVA